MHARLHIVLLDGYKELCVVGFILTVCDFFFHFHFFFFSTVFCYRASSEVLSKRAVGIFLFFSRLLSTKNTLCRDFAT